MDNLLTFFRRAEKKIAEYRILSNFQFMKGMRPSELKAFSKMFVKRVYKPGETVFKQGYPHAVLYLVVSGKIDIQISDGLGNTINLDSLGPYKHFGEIVLFLDSIEAKRSATAISVENSVLWAISKKDFIEFIKLNPKAGIKLLINVGEHFADLILKNNEKIKTLECKPIEKK